jgi:transposase
MHQELITERKEAILADSRAGMSRAAVAERHGVSIAYVSTLAKAHGLSARKVKWPVDEVVKAYLAGTPVRQIAEEANVDLKAVYTILHKANIPLRRG